MRILSCKFNTENLDRLCYKLKTAKIHATKVFRGFSGFCVPNRDVFPDLTYLRNPNRRYDKQICSLQPSSFFYLTLAHPHHIT